MILDFLMPKKKQSEHISGIDTAWLRMERPTNLMMITGVMIFSERLTYDRLRATQGSKLQPLIGQTRGLGPRAGIAVPIDRAHCVHGCLIPAEGAVKVVRARGNPSEQEPIAPHLVVAETIVIGAGRPIDAYAVVADVHLAAHQDLSWGSRRRRVEPAARPVGHAQVDELFGRP